MTAKLVLLYSALCGLWGVSSAAATAPRPNVFDWDSIRYMYAFGDSYTFVQGTVGHANFSFIGDALDLSFTPKQLLNNQIIPKNIEFLTGCMGGSPSRCSKQLWNFAFAGSDIDGALLPLHHNFTIPLVDQVNQWQKAHDNGLKTHLFINVPAEDRSPGNVGNPVQSAKMKTHLDEFNTILANHIASFKTANAGKPTSFLGSLCCNIIADATIMTFDSNAWFNMVLDSPSEFGFTNVTGFCTCADPAGFFWYNTGHPTERVHKLLAGAIEAQLRNCE
ncbi:hypothetical protein B0H10DRAFT_2229019 [Mycena sp. CBHHK59/15]|nr:hypothetical protein B0H10DRAFT_2229019 [Mycena sp. CBHHK59/15]